MKRSGLVLVLGLVGTVAFGQPAGNLAGLLGAMDDAYERLDYETAEERAREALASYDLLSADQLVRVHTTLGLILYARNEPLEARTQFLAALSLNAGLELDPVLVSPKTLAFFDDLRSEVGGQPDLGGEATIRYVQIRDPRPAATLRSLAVPGWGQLYKGEQTKGWALLATWGLLAGGTVGAHVMRGRAQQDYRDAEGPVEIEARYADFNTWHRTRGALGLGALTVWAYATVDALVWGAPEVRRGIAVAPMLSEEALGLRLRVRLGP